MFTSLEMLPPAEAAWRQARCRTFMHQFCPEASGLLVASPLHIYYLTGTLGMGLLWLPLTGEPVLMLRKGLGRAELESPLAVQRAFRSFREVPALCAEAGSPLGAVVAVEMQGLNWSMGQLLQERLAPVRLISGDAILPRTRQVKSVWELTKLRLGGARHRHCLCESFPPLLKPGMSERAIGLRLLEIFLAQGHGGLIRLTPNGDETFFGSVCAGESGLYPSSFDGPLGVRGMHPALPYMGDAGTIWTSSMLLTLDMGFTLEGYNTDMTRVFWSGPAPIPDAARRAQDLCLAIEAEAAAALRPGALPSAIWRAALDRAVAGGAAETFMGVGPDRVRFLGHGIGLHVAEGPVFADRFDEPLEAGMVVALEPKIALPGLGMVGVENTWEITEQGCTPLTGSGGDIEVV